jgi:hypothetical protein
MRRLLSAMAILLVVLVAGCVPPPATGAGGTPPPAPKGLTAVRGGGSGEVELSWTALPPVAGVAFYRVYEQKQLSPGVYWLLAVVSKSQLPLAPGRIGIVDAPDYWPWPTGAAQSTAKRCYVVTAVSVGGLEGAMSAPACGSPPGGPS